MPPPGPGADPLDRLDMGILAGLAEDSSVSIPLLAEKIKSNQSVIYARIRRLIRRGIIERYTIVVNERALGYGVKAIVGISMNSRRRGAIVDALLGTPGIGAISEVTGRFDILATVYARTLEEIHELVSERMGKIEGIVSSETFIEMKSVSRPMPYAPPGAK